MKFKRAMLTAPYKMDVYEVDEEPAAGQVLIRVEGCGMCNWELNFWHGNLNFFGYPHKLGHEYAGVVERLGEGCTRFSVGDKVSVLNDFSGFGEYAVVDESCCEKLADHVDVRYAMGEPQKCVVTVLDAAAPKPADFGVVQGCGPMGLWCIQALAGNYLGALIAVDIDDEKLELAKKFGATHTINSKRENVVEVIAKITDGHMADFAIEGTGIPALLDQAQDLVKRNHRGRLILMSSHHAATAGFDFRKAVDRGLTIIAAHPPFSGDENDDFRRAVAFISNGTFKNEDLVSHVFTLDQIQTAFETLDHKPEGFKKAIVIPR